MNFNILIEIKRHDSDQKKRPYVSMRWAINWLIRVKYGSRVYSLKLNVDSDHVVDILMLLNIFFHTASSISRRRKHICLFICLAHYFVKGKCIHFLNLIGTFADAIKENPLTWLDGLFFQTNSCAESI